MSFGFGFGFTKITAAIRAAFSPSSLFAANEPGVWYDPSDLSTLFQDAAGTTPVTAVEQPVGLMLDKSGNGNHAFQTTATSRPVLSARVNQYLATETLATQNVTTLAAQYRLSFEGTGTITLSGTATGVYSAGSHLITCTAGTLTSTVSGSVTKADLRVANDGANLPPYQRVNTATDYDTAGFQHYLCFDGVDDRLVTAGIVWSAACDCFTAVRHTGGAQWVDVWLTTNLGSGYWAVGQSGSSYPPNQTTVGSPAYFVDGTALNPVTRGEIYTRCINQTRIVETRRLNLMASTGGLSIGGYPSYLLNGRLCGLVIAEGVTDAEASSVRRWLAGKAGVAL